ncbi:syringopeptin non-ribosomal peptide synthetase SypA, partial [Pseudomonas syringae]|nr:syringopeptin non-ribosomal peptide synthetase SypA [Pseudomonas syringae]
LEQSVTVLWMTAGLFHQYASGLGEAFSRLRYLIVGGDVLDPAVINRVLANNPPHHLLNGYGPTEATTFSATYEITSVGDGSIPIGKPVGNSRLYVLDGQGQPVPLGVPGELYIGGQGVAKGYLNRAELSATQFVVDPFSPSEHALMYRTGDLVRWRADGNLEYLGRNDDQVKIRGFRVELGEIEVRLAEHADVSETVVLCRQDVPGDKRLVAYVTARQPETVLDIESLRSHLQGTLPEYMVPAAYVQLDALPLTANGKLDRKALPVPDAQSLISRGYEAPQGEVEVALAEIWAEVLQVERIGRNDNFFDLGGHSLLAMRMVSQVRLQLGVELPLGELFARAELAAVAAALGGVARSELTAILPVKRDQPMPLSFAQQRLWFLAQMDGGNQAYNIPMALSLEGTLDVTALTRALARIVERHETLRSRLVSREGAAQVLFAPTCADATLSVEDIRHVPHRLQEAIRVEAVAPFNLADGPLIRAHLLHVADDRHVLLLTVHHIVADGWSMGVLSQELLALYPAFCQGQPDPLPPLAIQYTDYAVWQRRWLSGERLQHQAAYWRQALEGAPTLLTLPTDRPRPAQQDFAGASLAVQLNARLTADLRQLAQRQGVTLYMALMTAWATTLTRLSGQAEVVIGSPVAGRGRSELEDLVGLFVNTLAVRIDTSGNPSGEALLAQVKTRVLEAQEHQDLPFEQVVEVVRPTRSLAHPPLFQNTLNWMPGKHAAASLGDLRVVPIEQVNQVSKFDLSLNLSEQGETLLGTLDYATALFDEATAQRYLGYFVQVLETLANDEQTHLDRITLVGKEERRYLLETLNTTAPAQVNDEQTVHAMIEARAASAPEGVAAQVGEQCLHYGELNHRANALAHHMISLGVGVDDRVAVMARRGLDTLVAMLAVLKAGAGYVPVDPSHPDERIAYLLADSAPKVLLTQQALISRVPETAAPVIAFDRPQWPQRLDNPQVAGLNATHLAYVIYTSGSTGQPKGVMVEHRTLGNLIDWHCRTFDLQAGSHTASVAGFGFDAMAWEVWPALCAGATLHLPPAEVSNEHIDALLDWWIAQPLQVAFLPTPVAEYAFSRNLSHPTLRTLLIGGDRLRQFQRDPGFAVINNYGPTEATVVATSGRLLPDGSLDIGTPIANTRVYLLDEHQQLVPLGVAGELYVAGEGVARGYLNRPEMTAERFLRDPFYANSRMYRTGDLARWNADGTLDYLGRNDDQVKIRGLRVELGEIEAQLSQLPGIEEALVLAREDEPGQPRLAAYFIERAGSLSMPVSELRAALLAVLPGYMVPSAFIRLDAWPLTANGKVDRKALPLPDREALPDREYEAPQGVVETAVAEIWSSLLHVERVGRHDHFFELGGHSLLAVNLIAQMRRQGLDADIRTLFTQPTLAALAAAVGGGNEITVPENAIPDNCTRITPEMLPLADLDQAAIDLIVTSVPGGVANVQDIYPLAPLQEGILYHHLAADAGDPYVLQSVFEIADRARMNAFVGALQSVVDRHDILRTAVQWQGLETPVQVVCRQARLPVEQVELDPLEGPIMAQLQQRFDPRHSRLDMSQAPLLRLVFAEDQPNQRWAAILLFHHMVLDHTALEVVLHDMQAHLLGQADQLEVAIPYRNYVAQARLGVSREDHEAFFREQLGDIDEPTLPFGLLDVQGDGRDIEESSLTLDRQLNLRLRAQARQLGVSAASLVHLAWAQVLSQVSGRQSVVFGTVLIGRMQSGEGAERALGMFINTLPLRVDLAGQGAQAGVRATHAQLTALLGHEHAPLVLAQRCSGVAAPLPLFSALLNYRHSSVGEPSAESIEAWRGIDVQSGEERTNYPLTLNVDDQGDGFRLSVLVTGKVGAGRVCGYMQTALDNLLVALEQSPDTALESLPILPAAEREQLLVGFNDTALDCPHEQTIHGLFEAQVERTPEAPAVVHGEQRLTYRELNEQANRLAHTLRKQGVQPDSRVGICVERSAEMVVGLLAILKAGGGYVPLDPAYPAERIAYMLQDSTPAAVLAQSATEALLTDVSVPVINLDLSDWQDESVQNPQVPGLTSAHLAYLIYTSGSTGLPKGVMIEHRNTVNFLSWAHTAFDGAALEKTLFSTSLNFDLAVYECFAPLTSGGRIEVVSNVLQLQHGEHDIGLINTVPSALKALLEINALPESVHTVNVAGEALKRSLVENLFEKTSVQRLCNLYGPSETTTYSSWVAMDRERGFAAHIGKPVGNTQFYLLDQQQQPVPLGVAGEIYIGGGGVARGYLNRDDLTAERFLADPFSPQPAARMYRTGDLGRYLPDGNIEYLGRNDDQVKIRGFRIELGEIDACLARHPAVQDAVVTAREDVPGDKRLVAYYTVQSAQTAPDIDSLRGWLLGQLPAYMVPVAYVRLDALPLTPNGKLDRKALPAPGEGALISRGYEAPQGEREILIAGIWQDLLGVTQVGRHDHFFELGGHSLLAVSLMERMRQEGLEAEVKSLFKHPTLSEYAATTERMEIVL